jgi:uncharacterized coiled-coil DUF342 family protein
MNTGTISSGTRRRAVNGLFQTLSMNEIGTDAMTDQNEVDSYFLKIYKENLQLKAEAKEAADKIKEWKQLNSTRVDEIARLRSELKELREAYGRLMQEIVDRGKRAGR